MILTHGLTYVNNKLSLYLKRSFYLKKSKFSIKNLKTIYAYWQKSRLLYGMGPFLHHASSLKKLEANCSKFVISILKVSKFTRNKRKIIAIIGEPSICDQLLIRLVKSLKKYYNHFGEKPLMWEEYISKRIDLLKKYLPELDRKNKEFEEQVKSASLCLTLKELYNTESSITLFDVISKHWWRNYNCNDTTVMKLLSETGWLSLEFERKCSLCNEDIRGVKHIINVCQKTDEIRKFLISVAHELKLQIENGDFHKFLKDLYFKLNKMQSKRRKKVIYKVCADLIKAVDDGKHERGE
jgi:hypothetical protein